MPVIPLRVQPVGNGVPTCIEIRVSHFNELDIHDSVYIYLPSWERLPSHLSLNTTMLKMRTYQYAILGAGNIVSRLRAVHFLQ